MVLYKRYDQYEDSGIEWIGKVPRGWDIKRIGELYEFINEKVSDEEYPPLSVTKTGVVPQMENVAKTIHGDNRKKVSIGDFVINSRADRPGSCGVSNYNGSVSTICHVMKPRNEKVIKEYGHHLFRNYRFSQEFYRWGRGIVDDLWSTRQDEMKKIMIPVPTVNEQIEIAKYLDLKTAEIDSLIADQEKLIALLEEYRQAIINEAVTKGLNPYPKMKDSGVDWIGAIPDGWKIKRLKDTCTINPNKSEIRADNIEVTFLPMEKIISTGVIDTTTTKNITEVYSGYTYFREEDLIIAKVTPCFENGNIAIAKGLCNGIGFGTTELHVLRVKEGFDNKFIFYVLQSNRFKLEGIAAMYGVGGLKRIPTDFIKNFKFAVPDINEQQMISRYLDKKTAQIYQIKSEIELQIAKLKEYRQSLIYEAVTGKIDVRGIMAEETITA